MGDFLREVLRHPIVLLLLFTWIVSWLGKLASSAARKAAEQAQRRAREQERELAAGQRPLVPRAPARPAPRPVLTPDEIAAEIRRAMGLEERPRRPEPSAVRPERAGIEADDRPPPRRLPPALPAAKPVEVVVGGPRRMFQDVTSTTGRADHRRLAAARHARLLDLSDPGAAIVAMEVLGPPRALRGLGE